MKTKQARRNKIKYRIRKKVRGTSELPRLSIYRSNTDMYAQLINDDAAHTILAMNSRKLTIANGSKSERAKETGRKIAEAAIAAGIKQVVFDRNGFLYHGRVKALAEGAREGGLQF